VGVYRLWFVNGRVYVVNRDGHGVADFATAAGARAYIADVTARQAALVAATTRRSAVA
jgi:hypothetical protein